MKQSPVRDVSRARRRPAAAVRELRLTPLMLSLVCLGVTPVLAQVLPVAPGGGIAVPGGGTVSITGVAPNPQGGQTMTITQGANSPRAIAQWQSFSIGALDAVNVAQPSASSILLNRVVGNEMSTIAGRLTANGHVFLTNPNGVLFSSGSSVSVGGLVATTMKMSTSDADFMNPATRQFKFERDTVDILDGNSYTVVNQGHIQTAGTGGTVALLGSSVSNQGTIEVARGSVGLVSADRITVDFNGDGLTQFTIPAGSEAAEALVQNSGKIYADGGRIALMAAANFPSLVVNQTGTLRANTLESRNGEIILSAGRTTKADGTAAYGNSALYVSNTSTIEATGGQVRIYSGQDITVSNNPPFGFSGNSPSAPSDGGSIINAAVLGATLGSAAGVTLESAALRTFSEGGPNSAGVGVRFDAGAQVLKTQGGTATLTVNSARNIEMAANSVISSSSGALNVDFNADAQGAALPDALPIDPFGEGSQGGAIVMSGARIDSNGGNIRFYGQGDPVNGRAVGGRDAVGNWTVDGVRLSNSTLNTCIGVDTCGGSGSISLRGQGDTGTFPDSSQMQSGAGVGLSASFLIAGGNVAVDGRGALGAFGVSIIGAPPRDLLSEAAFVGPGPSGIGSASGNISINGATRGWSTGDTTPDPALVSGPSSGVGIGGTPVIALQGDVRITGQGGDLSALAANAEFTRQALASSNSATVGASHGVLLAGSNVTAGTGRRVDISGQAGSNGFTMNRDPATGAETVVPDTAPATGVSVTASGNQGTLRAEGGQVTLNAQGGDLQLRYSDNSASGQAIKLVDVSSATRKGGVIDIGGRNILIANTFGPAANFLDASGAGGGGTISVRGTGSIAIDQNAGIAADAAGAAAGNGGTIHVVAGGDLRSYGSYSARGSQQGGNGGLIETSGANFDLTGIRVNASAPAGTAGTWLLDPATVTIASGTASGSLPPDGSLTPLVNSTVQDGDINFALNTGTSVTIATTLPNANSFGGDINFNQGVVINVDKGSAPVSFNLEASRDINGGFGTVIRSTAAPLNVSFTAGKNSNSGTIDYNGGQIITNGGSVAMTATGNGFGPCAICMGNTQISTLGGAADGSVRLSVPAPGTNVPFGGFTTAAIALDSTNITAGRGNVDITGFARNGTGVRVGGTLLSVEGGLGIISTTTGNINITGVGAFSSNSSDGSGHGVVIDNARVTSVNGNVAVRGLRQVSGEESGPPPGTGVLLQNGAQVTTTGTGDIEVTGETQGSGAGLVLMGSNGDGGPSSIIDGNRHVVLRAANDRSSDAIVLNGTVRAGQVLDLRPGAVNAATGAGEDRTAEPIYLMGNPTLVPSIFTDSVLLAPALSSGSDPGGFWISTDEMSRLTAAAIVAGGSTHAADIHVLAPLASGVPVTLQNNAGGNIDLGAPVSAPTLGLISGGNITQAAGASITAGTLLAQSFGGNVILNDPGNKVSADTLGGGAAGRFEFVNSGPLKIGPVSVIAYDSNGNQPQVQAADSMAANTLLVRTLSGELILDTAVNTTGGADLVAATTFQNTGRGRLGGAPWRVWADTWVGESRGGLVGSGQLPNLYHCAYLGVCTVTVSPGDNHFIYAQQPSLTVNIGSFARLVGQPNPSFTYTLAGLILGDTGAGIAGSMGTEAGLQSPAGRYPVFGTFTSAEGYLVNVVPGELVVTSVLPQPARFVDVLREEPTTYLYDRNIGQAPICLATGPLDGERAQQGNDVLAREWSRVRTRPNLTSCVDTERTNGCGDF